MLEAHDLSVTNGAHRVLSGVDLRVEPGTLVWIEGPSGSGKSTLLRALARAAAGGSGEITWKGERSVSGHAWRARVTLLPQPIAPLGRTIREDLLAPFSLRARRGRDVPSGPSLERELTDLGLADLGLDRPTAELSQGQLARVAVLRTVLAGPEVLLLDEPTANLDPASARMVAQRVLRFVDHGGTAVVAGHGTPWEGVDRHLRIEGGALREVLP